MKITPLEIRQKEFEKKLRGYDKDEVTAFLLSLSNEWERVLDTNKELTIKLQHAEKEVSKLREVESSLYKTLKTAEDTGANLIDQSNKAAELHMKETQMRAEGLLNEAKSKAKGMMEKAEVEARQIIEELQEAVKSIEQNHRDIENHRHNAIAELKNLSVDLIEKVERTTKERSEFKFDDYVKRVKALARESGERIKSEDTELEMPETPKIEESIKEGAAEEPKTTSEPVPNPAEPVTKAPAEVEEIAPEPETKKVVEAKTKREEKPKVQEESKSTNKARISRTVIPDNTEVKSTETKQEAPSEKEAEEPRSRKEKESEEPKQVEEKKVDEAEPVEEKQIEKPQLVEEEVAEEPVVEISEQEEETVLDAPEKSVSEEEIENVQEEQAEEQASDEEKDVEESKVVEEAVKAAAPSDQKELVEEAAPTKTKAKTVSFFDELDED